MAASDDLTRLAARAKQAEDRAAAARSKAEAELQADVDEAQASAQAQAAKLRETADAHRSKLSAWWHDMQRTWEEHVGKIRDDIESRRAEHDGERAKRHADRADDDAAFAVAFAYAAIEEAEYTVLDAQLARMKADQLTTA